MPNTIIAPTASPALASFSIAGSGNLVLVYPASQGGTLQWAIYGNQSWTPKGPVLPPSGTPLTTSGSPALAAFGDVLHLVYPSAQPSGSLCWATLGHDGTWKSMSTILPVTGIATNPSLAVYNDNLYLCFQDTQAALHLAYFDGYNWNDAGTANLNPAMSGPGSPTIASFAFSQYDGNRLVLVYPAASGSLAWATYDSWSWTPGGPLPGPLVTELPAGLGVYQGELYVIYQGDSPAQALCGTTCNPEGTWTSLGQLNPTWRIVTSASLAATGQTLYFAYQGTTTQLYLSSFDGDTWSDLGPVAGT